MAALSSLAMFCWPLSSNASEVVAVDDQHPLATSDTIAQDLSELEQRLIQAETEPAKQDTAIYGVRPQRNFNALNYTLDKRHRWTGDTWRGGKLWHHTFLEVGADAYRYYQQQNNYFMFTGLHLSVGRELSKLSSLRIGASRSLGYISGKDAINWTTALSMDYMFSFSNYLMGYRPERPLNVSGFIGLGYQSGKMENVQSADYTAGMLEKGSTVSARMGLQFKFFAGAHTALAIEPYLALGGNAMNLNTSENLRKFDLAYGVSLSYIWYFYNNLSQERNGGEFMRRFRKGERLFQEDGQRLMWRYPWFAEYAIGTSWFNRMQIPMGKTLGYSMNAAVGQWLSSALGMRLGVNVSNGYWSRTASSLENVGKAGGFLDAMINPLGFSRNYNWDSPVGFNLFGGYEIGKIMRTNSNHESKIKGTYYGYRVGTQLWARISSDLRLTIEPTFTLMQQISDETHTRERLGETDLKIGLSMLYRDRAHRNWDTTRREQDLPQSGFFAGIGAGWNTTVNRYHFTGNGRGLLLGGTAFLGYKFDDYNAVKLMGEYVTNPVWNPNNKGELSKYTYKNKLLSVDYQLNLLNLMSGYNPRRHWNIYLFAGPTYASSKEASDLGANFGGMISYRVAPYLQLYYSHTLYWLSRNHYNTYQIYNSAGSVINTLNVGLLYNLNGFMRTIHNLPWRYNDPEGRRPWFVDYGYGYGMFPGMPAKASETWGTNLQVSVGYWISSFLGARIGVNMAKGSGFATVASDGNRDHDLKDFTGYTALDADLLINPFGFKKGYNWDAPVGLNLIMGAQQGLMQTYAGYSSTHSRRFNGFRLGTQLWARLAHNLRFTVEPLFSTTHYQKQIYISEDKDQLAYEPQKGYTTFDPGHYFSVKAGLTVLFGGEQKPQQAAESTPKAEYKGWFAGLGAGWNFLFDKRFYRGNGAYMNVLAMGGYRWNVFSSVRANAEWLSNGIVDGNQSLNATIFHKTRYNVLLGSLDYQLNLLRFLCGYVPSRKWDVDLFAGPAAGLRLTNRRDNWLNSIGVNGGMTARLMLSDKLSAFYNHNVYMMAGLSGARLFPTLHTSHALTIINTFNLGLMYRF